VRLYVEDAKLASFNCQAGPWASVDVRLSAGRGLMPAIDSSPMFAGSIGVPWEYRVPGSLELCLGLDRH